MSFLPNLSTMAAPGGFDSGPQGRKKRSYNSNIFGPHGARFAPPETAGLPDGLDFHAFF
jgi:hypothetical protein